MKSALKSKKRRKGKSRVASPRAFPYRAHAKTHADPRQAEFLDETIAIWQPRTTRQLNREDAREIVENITGFFSILHEWDRAERVAQKMAQAAPGQENPPQSDISPQSQDVKEPAPAPGFADR
jgi:hypothetical protein